MKIIIESADLADSITMRTMRPHNGIGVFLIGSEGWFGTPAPREEPIERFQTDGDLFPSRITQGPRIATFHGHGRFGSSIDAAAFMDKVNGLFGRELDVVEEGPNGLRSARGFLSADPEFELRERSTVLDFDLIVTCPNPLKLGNVVTVALANGTNAIMVDGNAPTWPSVEIVGSASSLSVTCQGRQVQWTGSIGNARLDFDDMQPSAGKVVKDNAFQLVPGRQNSVSVQCDGKATMSYRPAWR